MSEHTHDVESRPESKQEVDLVEFLVAHDDVTSDPLYARCPRRTAGFQLIDLVVFWRMTTPWGKVRELCGDSLDTLPEHALNRSARRLAEAGLLIGTAFSLGSSFGEVNGKPYKYWTGPAEMEPVFEGDDEELFHRLIRAAIQAENELLPKGIGDIVVDQPTETDPRSSSRRDGPTAGEGG